MNLTDDELQELAALMVWGVGEIVHCDGKSYEPWTPLPAAACADFMGMRRRRIRTAMSDPKFRKLFATNLDAMRNGERARNLATAIALRDDEGDKSAAFATARLKAIATIEGNAAGGVTVNVSQTNNSLTVTPGYVIKLRPSDSGAIAPAPALAPPSAAPIIDVTPEPEKATP